MSEAVAICVHELDLEHKTLTIHGKGSKERVIPLEKKAFQALKFYLAVRPKTTDQHCQVPEKLNIKIRVNKGQLADHDLWHSDQATVDLTLRVAGLDYKN